MQIGFKASGVMFLVHWFILDYTRGVKLRSWLGSSKFVEGQEPVGRAQAQTLAELNKKLYVFGGYAGSIYLNDLHYYQPRTRTWADLSNHVLGDIPSPRYGHAFISAIDQLFVFGGRSNAGRPVLRAFVSPPPSSS